MNTNFQEKDQANTHFMDDAFNVGGNRNVQMMKLTCRLSRENGSILINQNLFFKKQ